MPGEKWLLSEYAKAHYEAEKQRSRAKTRDKLQALRDKVKHAVEQTRQNVEQTRQNAERASKIVDKKEHAKFLKFYAEAQANYIEIRTLEAGVYNSELEHRIKELTSILPQGIVRNPIFDLDGLKQTPQAPVFDPGELLIPA